jgi:hypothetical protein
VSEASGGAAEFGAAQEAITSWARGDELQVDQLALIAHTAETHPGELDRPLSALPSIRRRRLVNRLREAGAEGLDGDEALRELADRIEELAEGSAAVSPDQELGLLKQLVADQPATDDHLARSLGAGAPLDSHTIGEWALDAQDRGLIEPAEPGAVILRWLITDEGLNAIGLPPAR